MTTPAPSDPTQVLRMNAALRAYASALREHSRAARNVAEQERRRNREVRRRTAVLAPVPSATVDCWSRGGGRPDASRWGASEGSPDFVRFDDLADILWTHHGIPRFEATIAVAVEMERLGLPFGCDVLSAGDAMDLVQRVVRGRP